MNNAIAYCRCSTDLQEMSIPDQRRAIGEYAVKNGLRILHFFEDEGKSGRYAEERPAFMRMIEHVETHNDFKFVLVYDVSRWGRFIDPQEATYWEIRVKKQGKQVLYVTEGFQNNGHIGDNLLKLVKNSEASEYALKLSKTSFRGHKTWAEKGYFVGGRAKFGYDRALYDESGAFIQVLNDGEHKATKTQHVKLLPNLEQARIVKMIFDMRANDKMGLRAIANRLNEQGIPSPAGGKWGSSSLWYMLNDEVYAGDIVYNKQRVDNLNERNATFGRFKPKSEWIICKDAHEAIISKEQFARAQEGLGPASKTFGISPLRVREVPYLLSGGLMVCSSCGHRYQGQTNRSHGCENSYYICGGYHMKGRSVCDLLYIPRDKAEGYAIEGIQRRISAPKWRNRIEHHLKVLVEKNSLSSTGDLARTKAELAKVETSIDNFLDAIEKGGLDCTIAIDRIGALQKQKETLQGQLETLKRHDSVKGNIETTTARIMSYMTDFKRVFSKGGPVTLKRSLLEKFMLPVRVDTKARKLYYSFLKVPMAQEVLAGVNLPYVFETNPPHHLNRKPS